MTERQRQTVGNWLKVAAIVVPLTAAFFVWTARAESRLSVLEAGLPAMARDVGEIKQDLRELTKAVLRREQ